VLLGSLSGISISKLLIGGVVPGLLLSLAFVAWIVVRVRVTPSLAPNVELVRHAGFARFKPFLLYVLPLVSIFGVVVGAMAAGWGTPTESAAIGALATIVLALVYRALSWKILLAVAEGHGRDLGDDPLHHRRRDDVRADPLVLRRLQRLAQAITGSGLAPWAVIMAMMAMLIFLGVFVDQVSMMLITLPIFMPVVQALGVDPSGSACCS
jgi:TRAP-type C4-dicarboxylate transport system permease large subunit